MTQHDVQSKVFRVWDGGSKGTWEVSVEDGVPSMAFVYDADGVLKGRISLKEIGATVLDMIREDEE